MSLLNRVTHAALSGVRWLAPARAALSLMSLLSLLSLTACDQSASAQRQSPAKAAARARPTLISSQRTGRLRRYPCADCHQAISPDQTTRAYTTEHAGLHFKHFAAIEQCGLCHDPSDMNRLRLLDGDHASFDAAEQVCGQCHGEKLRDFRIGAHGKLMGSFREVKYRYVCTDCHDPHAPRRERMQALPPPPFPALGIPKGTHP